MSLADVAGPELTRQAVHLIETGKVRPTMRSLSIIARRLGVPIGALIISEDAEGCPRDVRAERLERLCDEGRFLEAIALAEQLLAKRIPAHLEATALFALGRAKHRLSRPDEAITYYVQARNRFMELENPWLAAETIDWEAGARYLKDDPTALPLMEEALQRYRSLEPRKADVEARMLERLATILVRHRLFERARFCYQEALSVAGRLLDLQRLGYIYHGLSRCEEALGDVPRAIHLGSRALTLIAVNAELRPGFAGVDLPRTENDMGVLFMRNGELGRAEELLVSAMKHLDSHGVQRMKSYVLHSLAELRRRQGHPAEALKLAQRAVDLAEEQGERMSLIAGLQQLALTQAGMGDHDLADRSFERALEIAAELGLAERRAECLAAYRAVLEARGDTARLKSLGA